MIFVLFWIKWLSQKFLLSAFQEKTACTRGEGNCLLTTLTHEKGTKTSDYLSNGTPLKYIRLPFLQKPYMPPGYNLQLFPWGLWGGCHPQRHWMRSILTDRIFRICSPKFIEEELLLLKEILISNHYPGWLIDQTFSKRRKKFLECSDDILETTEKKDIFCSLPYVPGLSEKLKRILQNNGLKVALRGSNTLASFLNSGKDRTSIEQQKGVYKIPCTCGSSYVGRTNQNLKRDCYNIIILFHRL